MYDGDDEEEGTPLWKKRQHTTQADGDTRVVKHRCDSPPYETLTSDDDDDDDDDVAYVTPPFYSNQEQELAELPWGPVELSDSESESESDDGFIIRTPPHYYDDVGEDAIASSPAQEDDDDDKDFTFSPASPPLIPSTQVERASSASPPTIYVFPDETVVVTPDGRQTRIPDQRTITHPMMITQSTSTAEDSPSSSSTIEDPKRSTSTKEEEEKEEEDARKVCFLDMQHNIAGVIVAQWRASAPSTVEEVTVDVCRSLAVTMLAAPYQNIIIKYVRCAIRRQS